MLIPPDIQARMRPELAGFEPYDPGFTPCEVNVSANENTRPMPEEVRADLVERVSTLALNRYPDPLSNDLRERIARLHGVDPASVFVANGGDEALFLLFLALGGPGRTLCDLPPTFSVYRLYASMVGTRVVDVMRDPETFAVDWEGLAAADADLAIITTPNNPTGNTSPRDEVMAYVESARGLVVVDEAYQEFAPAANSVVSEVATHGNLVVLRTLSKAYGLAGARIGYLIAPPGVVAALAAVRQPYSVNVLSQAAAAATLDHAGEYAGMVADIVADRDDLAARLAALEGVTVFPSASNFLLVRLPHAHEIRGRLRDEFSILVRDVSDQPLLADCLRVTVGTREENDRIASAIATLLEDAS